MQCVVLQPKGTSRNANLPNNLTELPTVEEIGKLLRRTTAPDLVGVWKWTTKTIHLFGYKTGKTGTENKHEIPPPHDATTLFGEAVLVATSSSSLETFTTAQYTKFYNEITQPESDDDSDEGDESEEEIGSDVEEEEENAEDSASESESEKEDELPIDEEDEDAPPVAVRIVKAVKRANKKTAAWYSLPELIAEEETAPHPIREACLLRLQILFASILSEEERKELEYGLYRFTIEDAKRRHTHAVWENPEFQTLYDVHVRRVVSNLNPNAYVKNRRLLDRLREGEFKVWEIPAMTFSDLCPENWRTLEDRETKREAKMLEVDTSAATDMFRCSRCGKRQCTYYEQQTRSADEPMTIFIRCVNCGKQWRQ
jgi:transcription elongation factor S-II